MSRLVNDQVSYHLGNDYQVERPLHLDNGATILAYYPESTRRGVVLAFWRDSEFVVWDAYWHFDERTETISWQVESGDYYRGFEGEQDAWERFARRSRINRD